MASGAHRGSGGAADVPRVSAIVIFRDAGPWLEEAIESVFAQTFASWELILCDDGSRDISRHVAESAARRFPDRVRVVSHPGGARRGTSATRNLGLAHARGELVGWLDADDVWLPDKLALQVAQLDEHPTAAMTFGPLEMWRSHSGSPRPSARDTLQPLGGPADCLVAPPELLLRWLGDARHMPSGVLGRRAVLEAVGGFDERFSGAWEDALVHAKICLGYPVYASSTPVYRYRLHDQQSCARARLQGRERGDELRFLEALDEHVQRRQRGGSEGSNAGGETLAPVVEAIAARRRRLAGLRGAAENRGRQARALAEHSSRLAARLVAAAGERLLPGRVRAALGRRVFGQPPPRGWVDLGDVASPRPVSRVFGFDRGTPVDRFYIERFLASHADDIRGRVLEVGEATYTTRFGRERVRYVDVLHARDGNPRATIVGDLAAAETLEPGAFDCVVLTQVLGVIFDVRAAIDSVARALAPGGVVLATLPGICPVSRHDEQRWGDLWRFTPRSARRLFSDAFGAEHVEVDVFGNALAATAFVQGLCAEELAREALLVRDEDYPVTIGVRAVKTAAP